MGVQGVERKEVDRGTLFRGAAGGRVRPPGTDVAAFDV